MSATMPLWPSFSLRLGNYQSCQRVLSLSLCPTKYFIYTLLLHPNIFCPYVHTGYPLSCPQSCTTVTWIHNSIQRNARPAVSFGVGRACIKSKHISSSFIVNFCCGCITFSWSCVTLPLTLCICTSFSLSGKQSYLLVILRRCKSLVHVFR
jgi:hypothetical protein